MSDQHRQRIDLNYSDQEFPGFCVKYGFDAGSECHDARATSRARMFCR
jgi:hypothetical protein